MSKPSKGGQKERSGGGGTGLLSRIGTACLKCTQTVPGGKPGGFVGGQALRNDASCRREKRYVAKAK